MGWTTGLRIGAMFSMVLSGCSPVVSDGETGTTGSTGLGSSSGSTVASTVASTSTDSSAGASSAEVSSGPGTTAGWESADDSDGTDSAGFVGSVTDTDGPLSPCINDDIELSDVVFEITTHRVMGEDVETVFDPAQGSGACLQTLDGGVRLTVDYGPFDGYPLSRLILEVNDGIRSYDLAEDAGVPGTGNPGLIGLDYSLEVGATTYSYGTDNQAATGTVDVIALPLERSTTFEFDAAGNIAGADGWLFDLHFSGTVPGT